MLEVYFRLCTMGRRSTQLIATHWPGDSDHVDGSDNLDRIKEYYWRPADRRGGEVHRNMRRTGPGSGSGKKVDCSWWRECCSWRRAGRAWPWPWRRWPGWRWWWRWRRHWRCRWWGGRPPGPSSPPTSGPWWPPAARLVQSGTIQCYLRSRDDVNDISPQWSVVSRGLLRTLKMVWALA